MSDAGATREHYDPVWHTADASEPWQMFSTRPPCHHALFCSPQCTMHGRHGRAACEEARGKAM
eukprot:CAMPEP_0195100444 /NCGR_PEP_ID=MMETSP0448-20130528/63183_1 /TAXON_ID=66468 /ORGANISM="Heterocapsa triquestra, Strain CCMP 448" /LENGTH=62 /DNA_ID=CAMNT_0040135587 /DNA_START=58 /DNA_END=243 /DNA_ORIENTATION=+